MEHGSKTIHSTNNQLTNVNVQNTGHYLPDFSDAEEVKEATKVVGQCYLASKFPPLEVARWVYALWITPWCADTLGIHIDLGDMDEGEGQE